MIMKKILSFLSTVNTNPLFILGNQKSGTTVIANLLSQATSKSLTNDFQSAIAHKTLQLELSFKLLSFPNFIHDYKYEFSKDIIKEPFLSYYIDELINEFPNARFILIVRDPYQNIRSILNRLKVPGNLQKINFSNFVELEKTLPWKLALQSKMLGINSINYIEAMAHRWNYLINLYEKNKEKIILVKYEDFVKDKKGFIDNLTHKLGFDIKQDISNYVNVQYQPKGNSKVDLDKFFGSKNSDLISKVCKNNMNKLGYY